MRYVILEHRFSEAVHWDFLMELPSVPGLHGWAVECFPLPVGWSAARLLTPHRPVYLSYEGPVYGAGGWVKRVDEGRHEILEKRPEEMRIRLRGRQHLGTVELIGSGHQWSCRFNSHSGHSRLPGSAGDRFPLLPRSSLTG